MKDKISIERVKHLHPKVIEDFKNFVTDAEQGLGVTIRVVWGTRTFDEQNGIYAQGRTKPGKIVTWSKAGQSYHNYGLAIDICPFFLNSPDLNWKFDFHLFKPFAEKYAIKCGLDFPEKKKDPDHFQKTFDWGYRALLDKYNKKDFIPNTTFVNI